jgi:AbrB family looped-hinge helix DNA binding protein
MRSPIRLVDNRGRVTLPAALGLRPGDHVRFVVTEDDKILLVPVRWVLKEEPQPRL